MDEKLMNTILTNTYTKASLLRRLALFRSFLEHKHYSTSGFKRLKTFFEEKEVVEDDAQALQSWSGVFNKRLSRSTFYKKLEAIRKEILSLPSVTVYLPFIAQESELTKIGQWLRAHVKKQMIMDVKVDPALVGGCALVWNGYYRDYSLHRQFKDKREDINQLISDFEEKKEE